MQTSDKRCLTRSSGAQSPYRNIPGIKKEMSFTAGASKLSTLTKQNEFKAIKSCVYFIRTGKNRSIGGYNASATNTLLHHLTVCVYKGRRRLSK